MPPLVDIMALSHLHMLVIRCQAVVVRRHLIEDVSAQVAGFLIDLYPSAIEFKKEKIIKLEIGPIPCFFALK